MEKTMKDAIEGISYFGGMIILVGLLSWLGKDMERHDRYNHTLDLLRNPNYRNYVERRAELAKDLLNSNPKIDPNKLEEYLNRAISPLE